MAAGKERPMRALAEDSDATARRQPATARSGYPDQARTIHMDTTGSTDASGPNPALVSAFTTEHYTLQSSRASTIVEANGRSMLFLSSVSGATSRWRWWRNWTGWATPS